MKRHPHPLKYSSVEQFVKQTNSESKFTNDGTLVVNEAGVFIDSMHLNDSTRCDACLDTKKYSVMMMDCVSEMKYCDASS